MVARRALGLLRIEPATNLYQLALTMTHRPPLPVMACEGRPSTTFRVAERKTWMPTCVGMTVCGGPMGQPFRGLVLLVSESMGHSRWLVPIGAGIGQTFRIGAQPVNVLVAEGCGGTTLPM
jgi:hypothetical protein